MGFIPDSILIGVLATGAVVGICWFALIMLHAERVGSLDCPCRVRRDFLSLRLTIAREGAGPRPPTVQIRVPLPLHWVAHRMTDSDARDLAALLESASAGLRTQ